MIKHIVMWKLKEHAEGADRAANAAKMKALLRSYSSTQSLSFSTPTTRTYSALPDLIIESARPMP